MTPEFTPTELKTHLKASGLFGLIAFVVVILGTLGSIEGALLASLIVGVAESLGILFAGADLGLVVVFAILVVVLIFKPSGLMGGR